MEETRSSVEQEPDAERTAWAKGKMQLRSRVAAGAGEPGVENAAGNWHWPILL